MENIINLDYNTLDIGNKIGITGYIDFIKKSDVPDNVMKGCDRYKRDFIVFKSTIIYNDGYKIETFTIVFQRETDNKKLWMSCGKDGPYLFETSGGMNEKQIILLYKLLINKYFIIDIYNQENIYKIHEHGDNSVVPVRIDLGYY